MNKKGHKKRLKIRGLLVIILFIYLLGNIIYYFVRMPLKNIEITGNTYLKNNDITNYLNLDGILYIKANTPKIKKELLKLDLVKNAKVTKNLFGTLKIEIEEEDILFYNLNSKKIVLASGKEIEYDKEFLGIPILINIVPDAIYKEFIEKLIKVDKNILSQVSEMEYSPSVINDKVVDDKRFLFRMNDGNTIYINTINIEKINDYLEIYEAIVNKNGDINGCLYLDSNSENNHFNNCESEKIEVDEDNEQN